MNIFHECPNPYAMVRAAFNALYDCKPQEMTGSGQWYLSDYGIDLKSAFFPPEPLPTLPPAYHAWEDALGSAPNVLRLGTDNSPEALALRDAGEQWRQHVRSIPVINTSSMSRDRLLQKAHMVLASLVHYYVHSMPEVDEGTRIHVPRALAVPLVEVSRRLQIAPVLTFADVVLWNYEIDPSVQFAADNFHFRVVFSGTDDERNFYASSAQAELFGATLLPIMHRYLTMTDVADETSIATIAEDLVSMRGLIEEISGAIQSVRRTVDPKVFYDAIRPWWVGSTAERPWVYDGVRDNNLDLDGPSAGQSAVMHSLDTYLNIYGTNPEVGGTDSPKGTSGGFMERMRRYMPGSQRDFLSRLGGTDRPIRQVARATPALRGPYNEAVRALTKLRDLHIRIATLYIISMSKSAALCPFAPRMSRTPSSGSTARGTGGNEVSTLLKAGRDATKLAVIQD